MTMLSAFDLSTDFTQFFLGGFLIFLLFSVLLTWAGPKSKSKRKRGGKVDDRIVSSEGELID